jgi:hypothetical protein
MTKHLHALPLTLLFFRIRIAPLAVPILALTLYGQAFYGSVAGTITAADAQVIDDVPNVTQNLLFYAMLQNGVQPRNETSTNTLGDL